MHVVPPLRPDVTIVHAQRADVDGNTQMWGLLGCQRDAAFAAERVIVVCEELVDEEVIRSDPNRTVIPGLIVDAVVVEPGGPATRPMSRATTTATIASTSIGTLSAGIRTRSRPPGSTSGSTRTSNHSEYLAKLGEERWRTLAPSGAASSSAVDYGRYE